MSFKSAAFIAFLALTPSFTVAADKNPATVSVRGEAEFTVAPDMVKLDLGVETQAETAENALSDSSNAARQIMTALGERGVDPMDVQTQGLSLSPIYNFSQDDIEGREISGFRSSIILRVVLRDLEHLGEIIASVTENGANRIENIEFGLQNDAELRNEVRRQAVADALSRADLYAAALGTSVQGLFSLSETAFSVRSPQIALDVVGFKNAAASVPIARGEITIGVSVEVTFLVE